MIKGLEANLAQCLQMSASLCLQRLFPLRQRLSQWRLLLGIHHALGARHARYMAMQAFMRGAMGPWQLVSSPRRRLLH